MLDAPCKIDRPGNQQRGFLAGTDSRFAAQLAHGADELLQQQHLLLCARIVSLRPRLRERLHRDGLPGFARERRYVLPQLLGDERHERLSEPPKVARLANVKRTASAPNAGMPCGNCRRVRFSMVSRCFSSIRPEVCLASRPSRSAPSMRSSGSRMLPFDLDIFCPSSSRTIELIYTSRNGSLPVK